MGKAGMEVGTYTFGRYLRSVRIEQGIDLETVSRATRIGRDKLVCIEQENHDLLPAEVFVKGFIRSYAKAIHADPDEAVRLYQESLQSRNRTARSEAELKASNSTFWRRFLCSVVGFVVIVGVTIFFSRETPAPRVEPPLKNNPAQLLLRQPPPPAQSGRMRGKRTLPKTPPQDSMHLFLPLSRSYK
jgi:cytoskeleton protein RodZ